MGRLEAAAFKAKSEPESFRKMLKPRPSKQMQSQSFFCEGWF
jgi:hypothetical protein